MLALPDITMGLEMLMAAILARIVQSVARALWDRIRRRGRAEGAHVPSGHYMPPGQEARPSQPTLRSRAARAARAPAGGGMPAPPDAAPGNGRGGGQDTSLCASGSFSWRGGARSMSAYFNVGFGINSARNAGRDG